MFVCHHIIINTGLILGLCAATDRRWYFVTTSLIGWAQAYNQSCNQIGDMDICHHSELVHETVVRSGSCTPSLCIITHSGLETGIFRENKIIMIAANCLAPCVAVSLTKISETLSKSRNSTTCSIWVWKDARKCKCVFIVLQNINKRRACFPYNLESSTAVII